MLISLERMVAVRALASFPARQQADGVERL